MSRRRHRRRHYSGTVAIPGLGGLKDLNPLGKSVNSTNVLMGAGLGIAGGSLVKFGLAKFAGPKLPQIVKDHIEVISAAIAGFGAYALYRKKNKPKGAALLIGALIAGAAPLASNLLRRQFPQLGDMVDLKLAGYGDMNGFLVEDRARQMNGFLVNDLKGYAGDPAMAGLAALAADDDDYDN